MYSKWSKYIIYLFICFVSIGCKSSIETNKKSNPTYTTHKNIEWAQPDSQSLTMDIYVPNSKKTSFPVLIIYHGGGWVINTNEVMDSMSMYMAQKGEIVVCNVNYRLLGDRNNSIILNEIVEDAIGAYVWVRENIDRYQGDQGKIFLTGDSAGAHLAAMTMLAYDRLEEDGILGPSIGFNPTYIPKESSLNTIAKGYIESIKGALLSYGVFNVYQRCLNGYEQEILESDARGFFGSSINVNEHPEYYKAVSPNYLIPNSKDQKLPPILLTVGELDRVTPPENVINFMTVLQENNQEVEYWEYEGRPHAYLDRHKNTFSGTTTYFSQDAPVALNKLLDFITQNTNRD